MAKDIDLDAGNGFVAYGRSAVASKPFHHFCAGSPGDWGMRSRQAWM